MLPRYIIDFDSDKIPKIETDFLIIGGGNAGLRAAIEGNSFGDVLIITKDQLKESNTRYAQGGIAVAMGEDDTVSAHVSDTLKAGDGLCNTANVEIMVSEGIDRVKELIDWGANFDKQGGEIGFTMEGAHRRRRIIHARGDATGEETADVLVHHTTSLENVRIMEYTFAIDLLTKNGSCYGALILHEGKVKCIFAKATILASGGCGQVYKYTSNPEVTTGDGFAMAYRAGCEMMDMEFVQFHPTTLSLSGAPKFLISESVRGEGGILINSRGEIFMPKYHESAELAPRDVVSRAILNEMKLTGSSCVYLDITHLPADFIHERFPTISETCSLYGIDITTDLIPVQSAAHYMMGGVKTDLDANTKLSGLFACGEVACTGVHGANRLASNSLLEGLVFGTRAGKLASEYVERTDIDFEQLHFKYKSEERDKCLPEGIRNEIQELMWHNVGMIRDSDSLLEAFEFTKKFELCKVEPIPSLIEDYNIALVAQMIAFSALKRTESRGAHYRLDYPDMDDEEWKGHIVLKQENGEIQFYVIDK